MSIWTHDTSHLTPKFTPREWDRAISQAMRQHGEDCHCTTCDPSYTANELKRIQAATLEDHKRRSEKDREILEERKMNAKPYRATEDSDQS